MANHIKPSMEELKANIDASLKEEEGIADDTPKEETIEVKEEAPVVEETQEEEVKEEIKEEAPKEEIDYRKKFSESSREAQIQGFKNKEINRAYEEASKISEATEEDLRKEYNEWDDMTGTEQRLAKDNFINKKRFEIVNTAISKFKDVDSWYEKVDTFIEDPKTLIAHPELEGKQDEFKNFASKPTRRGLEFDDLLLAFSGDQIKNKPVIKKGEMFPSGSAGQKDVKPQDDKLTPMQARTIMKTDFKRYKELLLAGKIKNE